MPCSVPSTATNDGVPVQRLRGHGEEQRLAETDNEHRSSLVVREAALDRNFLGRPFDRGLINELNPWGVDVYGENGEFHTVVTDGPLLARPLGVNFRGERALGDCVVLELRHLLEHRSQLCAGHWFPRSLTSASPSGVRE
jgi:hypothetical protein